MELTPAPLDWRNFLNKQKELDSINISRNSNNDRSASFVQSHVVPIAHNHAASVPHSPTISISTERTPFEQEISISLSSDEETTEGVLTSDKPTMQSKISASSSGKLF